MNRIKLPINEIQVEDRQRQDLGNIPELAASLQKFGLIQPIVIDQSKRLLAGGRRLAAATHLGWSVVDVVYKETLTLDEAYEIELEENVRRKDMTWQERCLNIATIHALKKRRKALEGESWGLTETGELFGLKKAHTSYCITIAEKLKADTTKEGPYWKAEGIADAWRVRLKEQETEALKILAERQRLATESATLAEYTSLGDEPSPSDPAIPSNGPAVDYEKEDARERYLRNPLNDPAAFDSYWAERVAARSVAPTIHISRILINQSCLDFMANCEVKVDHIITDIPYGNDMSNLDTFANIETVEKEHDVSYVRKLMAEFFPRSFRFLKDTGFLVTWCDQELWQYMYDLATAAGYKVQRWPLTWIKSHPCKNNAAQYNYTKNTEIAMVCRKGNITLTRPQPCCHIVAANDDLCDELDHPFAKPYAVWEFIFDAVSIPGQLIYEPFAGQGSGVISLMRGGRNVLATELNTEHYNKLLYNVKRLHFEKINPAYRFL